MTTNREDYLKTIYHLNQQFDKVTNRKIADALDISAASVSEMLKKLEQEKFIEIDNGHVLLTAVGKLLAEKVISKHRLWETFLLTKLNYDWHEVHDQAEILEHVTDDVLMERLNGFLNYPSHCPHGDGIFINQKSQSINQQLLGELKVGDQGKIVRVVDDPLLLTYLNKNHLELFTQFKVVEIDPYDQSMKLLIDDKYIDLVHKATNNLYVELINK